MTRRSSSPSVTPLLPRCAVEPGCSTNETPLRVLSGMIGGDLLSHAIGVAVSLRLADGLVDAPRTGADLAQRVGADGPSVRRFLRFLAAYGVFDELEEGTFALNDLSRLLRHDVEGSLAGWVELQSAMAGPNFAGVLHSAMTGQCAFDHVHKASFYEYLAGHPDLEGPWNETMAGRAHHLHSELGDLVDWSGVESVTDVGGNTGELLAGLLRSRPGITGIVFDQPHVVAEAADRVDADLAGRISPLGGDFFLSVPVGADLFLLANVIWNWPDDQAATILANCRAAMKPSSRLVVCEPVLPDGPGFHPAKTLDLRNFTMFGGRSRGRAEWQALLRVAGLELTGVRTSAMDWSVIETVPT